MATIPGIKYDDGIPGFSSNCFPVRSFFRQDEEEEADGAWLVAQRAEQRRRFKAILCNKPKTYARIKEERRRAEKQGTTISEQNFDEDEEEEEKEIPTLDGFFLMKHCCIEDPSDLCSVNISGQEMGDVKEEDLALFDNVAYVNASENYLPFEAFRGFPILRELEMPLNGLRSIKHGLNDYPQLEVLDLSYNNLSQDDLLTLGLLSNLKVLHLTGNNLKSLPSSMAMPHYDEQSKMELLRFAKLEILLLDDNKLSDVSVFAALAGLSRLKHLNLEKNEIYYIPMLKSVEGKVVPNESKKDARRLRKSAKKSGRTSVSGILKKPTEDLDALKVTPAPGNESVMENGETGDKDVFTEDLSSLSRQITELDLEKELTFDDPKTVEPKTVEPKTETPRMDDMSGLPPFPDLRLLNLAHNRIEDEEALLAVAAWPMVVELVIHNNPLTTENSGDPPLLTRFLGERLAIKIIRKSEQLMPPKPVVEVHKKKSRTVSTIVPKIPKLSVDDLLMLEAPKPPTQPKPEKSRTRESMRLRQHGSQGSPAPTSRSERERSKVTVDGEDHREQQQQPQQKGQQQQEGDAFFMTQVDDQLEEEKDKEVMSARKERRRQRRKEKEEKYKGYEILLDAVADPQYSEPKDMHGNIKALKFALRNELIYRDPTARLDRISKPVEPYRKVEKPVGPPRVTQLELKDTMLEQLRSRNTSEEAGLSEVLVGGNNAKRQFPEAERLLSEIQRRYNTVRVNSMKEAKDVRKALVGSQLDMKKSTARSQRVKMEV